jgi:uncharacterized protein (DUF697 family)
MNDPQTTTPPTPQTESQPQPENTSAALSAVDNVMRSFVGSIEEKHITAANARVAELRARHPEASTEHLANQVIRQKCIDTGAVGLASSVPGLIPGVGSMLVVSAGLMVDLRKTMEMQKELVLELAALYGRSVTPADRRNLLLLVTGVDSGNKLIAKAGSEAAAKVTTRLSSKALSKALPVAGIVTSAAVNVVSTYLVGRRAQAYLRADPSLANDWDDALRTLSGVDERNLTRWLLASLDQAQGGLAATMQRVGGAVGSAGRAVVGGTGNLLTAGRDRLLRRSRPAPDAGAA